MPTAPAALACASSVRSAADSCSIRAFKVGKDGMGVKVGKSVGGT